VLPLELGQQEREPLLLRFRYCPISAHQSVPSCASSSSDAGLDASRDPSASATKGTSGTRSACAATSWPVPASPRIRIACARRAASRATAPPRTGALVPSAASDTARLAGSRALESARDRPEQLLQADRLLEEIECADARGLDRGLDRPVARHHHHRHREQARGTPLAQQRDAVGVRHPDVEQDQRGLGARAVAAGLLRVLGDRDAIALVLQDLGQQLADADLIVDDQDFAQMDGHGATPPTRERRVALMSSPVAARR
jgi:hypothetical protein